MSSGQTKYGRLHVSKYIRILIEPFGSNLAVKSNHAQLTGKICLIWLGRQDYKIHPCILLCGPLARFKMLLHFDRTFSVQILP